MLDSFWCLCNYVRFNAPRFALLPRCMAWGSLPDMEHMLRLLGAGIVSVLVAAASNVFDLGLPWWASALIGVAVVYGIVILVALDVD